jgi:AcrR family transcriptional regulator
LSKTNLSPRTKATSHRRRRRTTEEVIDRLLQAACEEFETNGYSGTKTAAIARKAGVTEPQIFNHFGSKAQLFHDAVFKPLDQLFVQFCATHAADDAESVRVHTRQYILELKQFIERHSKMLTSLVVTQAYGCDGVRGVGQIEGLNEYFDRTAALGRSLIAGKPAVDPKLMTRLSFAAVLASVIFKDWLFPKNLASDEDISEAISGFVMDGINRNARAEWLADEDHGAVGERAVVKAPRDTGRGKKGVRR